MKDIVVLSPNEWKFVYDIFNKTFPICKLSGHVKCSKYFGDMPYQEEDVMCQVNGFNFLVHFLIPKINENLKEKYDEYFYWNEIADVHINWLVYAFDTKTFFLHTIMSNSDYEELEVRECKPSVYFQEIPNFDHQELSSFNLATISANIFWYTIICFLLFAYIVIRVFFHKKSPQK